ncbi:nucleotide exchange factor GrpE [Candidatus Pelagibacter sp.]|nr:nucleotide exchange factor GrpE [Candidatus Pelagibacter sp.]|tara:strand:- start:67 stop:690 length:624 start_codon:yes stop_codon:yes gene_type:complete
MEKEKAEQYNSETKDGLNKENEDTQSSAKDDAIDNKKTPEDKIADLEEKLVRQYAEMENQRRRYEKEKEDAFEYGGFTLAKETLNLIDNLERSKVTLENDQDLKNSEGFDKIVSHLDIIYKDMISILKKNNILAIECIGKKLDPNLHQAMMEIEDESKESGMILQEIQKGFMMKDRLLRPSLVGVSKKKVKKEQNTDENKEKNDEKK